MKMKKSLLGLTILLSAGLTVHVEAADQKAVVATSGDIKPFSYQNTKGQLTGYDIQVIKSASRYIDGYDISFKKTAWDSIFVGLDSEIYQVAANNLSYTKERASKYLYSVPIAKNPLVLVTKKDSKIKSLDDIGGKKTEDDTGTSTAKFVDDWNKKHSDSPSTIDYSGEDVTKRLLDLDSGEFDYLIFDKISVNTIIKQKALDLKVIDLQTDDNPNNYIIFSSDSGKLQGEFNKAVKKLYDNGTLEKLSNKYLGGSYLPDKQAIEESK
ncbi:amino acid ABC transporter, substrate-binding protein [Streptococcus infantarius subsp. infantarius]|nr:amino acid ABC transporter, substrate-binding protein [Streptococcus infantarius subsp. infantarius]MCO4538930.1 amino acid ABC transporter, substrate-binding protein [Streptococcus infantarius subsp. infantarius]MCO4543762.1 amino acid ABC transporter, substrate-binding protein [Streptococcus infantarius subsp. infantarius]MCO4557892.1 amino acid ABC transporter, substrate-binding protein [Streptococcus infantarius subsp. infantarius]MCO4560145.1 amino acid ABC transporter, substrate-bindin